MKLVAEKAANFFYMMSLWVNKIIFGLNLVN